MQRDNAQKWFGKCANFPYLAFLAIFAFTCSLPFAHSQERDARDRVVETISQAELEQILAPIALYPDTILAHILVAATYPIEVVQAERWTTENQQLEGAEAVEAVEGYDWDPSIKALVAFPQILQRLSHDLVWTQTLGDAFLENEERVLASVQELRELAAQAGSLDEMDKVSVTRDDNVIVIEPREREVIYVPYYDTRVVYGSWRWAHYDPIYWDYPYSYGYYGYDRRNSFYWGPRVSVSFGFNFNTFHWRDRHIVRISSRHYRPRQYYGYRQIIDHDHAERWVHNPRHRRGAAYRNNHIRHRDYRQNAPRPKRLNNQQIIQHSQTDEIRGRLQNQRVTPSQNNSMTVNRNIETYRQSSEVRSSSTNYPSRNSRVVLPSRANPVNEDRRSPGYANPRANLPASAPVNVSRRAAPTVAPVPAPATAAPQPAATTKKPSPQAHPKRPNVKSYERATPRPKRVETKTRRTRPQPR
jgi:hypothetical protein